MEASPDPVIALERACRHRDLIVDDLREVVLANIVMCGEIPSPTFGEEALVDFVCERFSESGLNNISTDEAGNAGAILPGQGSEPGVRRRILASAHVDRIWSAGTDHTVTVDDESISGPGVADNSVGVAGLVSLPRILCHLGIRLNADLVLLGSTRSLGRGDLGGIRFFLENAAIPIDAAISLEGVPLERLSFSSPGMLRGEVVVDVVEADQGTESGAIAALNEVAARILAIDCSGCPSTSVILGSIEAGSTYHSPPLSGRLRFELRSGRETMVARILEQIEAIVSEVGGWRGNELKLELVARRKPGDLGACHALVTAAEGCMKSLGVEPEVRPSVGELSAMLNAGIPALTVGLTRGEHLNTLRESVGIEPVFTGLAQLVSILQFLDAHQP